MDDLLDAQPEQMNARQVAELLGASERTVVRWLRAGELPGIKLPGERGGWLIWREELRAWLHARHNQNGTGHGPAKAP